uniref:Uncharacterized protein n=1 Tax=Arundo donax TaxID=35708 RepID=A0A0A9U099_ARUDO
MLLEMKRNCYQMFSEPIIQHILTLFQKLKLLMKYYMARINL